MSDLNTQVEAVYNAVEADETVFTTPIQDFVVEIAEDTTRYANETFESFLQWEQACYKHFKEAGFEDCQTYLEYCQAQYPTPAHQFKAYLSFAEGWIDQVIKDETK